MKLTTYLKVSQKSSIPAKMMYKEQVTGTQIICEAFKNHFESVSDGMNRYWKAVPIISNNLFCLEDTAFFFKKKEFFEETSKISLP